MGNYEEGKTDNRQRNTIIIFAVIIVGAFILYALGYADRPINATSASEEKPKYSDDEDELFQAYFGVKTYLQESLRNPDSFEEIEEQHYFVRDSKNVHIQVCIKYRAENGFGGTTVEKHCFNLDKEHRIIKQFKSE